MCLKDEFWFVVRFSEVNSGWLSVWMFRIEPASISWRYFRWHTFTGTIQCSTIHQEWCWVSRKCTMKWMLKSTVMLFLIEADLSAVTCLDSLAVKVFSSRAQDPGFNSCLLCWDFSGLGHASDLKIGTPVGRSDRRNLKKKPKVLAFSVHVKPGHCEFDNLPASSLFLPVSATASLA